MGPYVLLHEIARGGMGIVYKAWQQGVGRIVALKTLRPELCGLPQFKQRFKREMRAAARLTHRNIVTVYDFREQDGQPYYTMAYIDGKNLDFHRSRLSHDPDAVLLLMEKVARAVHYAHEQGVLHRDLKPGNVLLDEDDEPFVADFGLAKLQDADDKMTQTGLVLGTVPYMSPEQACGQTRLGPASDVWSLGVILYELLTNRRPFPPGSREEMLRRIQEEAPTPARQWPPALGEAVETVVSRCLQRDIRQRYASAEALADNLARLVKGQPLLPQPGRWGRLLLGRAGRRLLEFLAAVVCLLAGVGLYLQSARTPRDQGPQPIVLINDTGHLEETHHWLAGEKESAVLALREDAFTIQSPQVGLVELLGTTPWDRFHLEADVLHEDCVEKGMGIVGIYFGHSSYPTATGKLHCFATVCFSDLDGRIGSRQLYLIKYQEPSKDDYIELPVMGRPQEPHKALLPKPGVKEWRHIAVDVTAREAVPWFEDQCINEEATLALLADLRHNVFFQLETDPKPFPVQRSLGLFVLRSTASFRNVFLRPPSLKSFRGSSGRSPNR
jgi:predicted Ser/Thr protein kinase